MILNAFFLLVLGSVSASQSSQNALLKFISSSTEKGSALVLSYDLQLLDDRDKFTRQLTERVLITINDDYLDYSKVFFQHVEMTSLENSTKIWKKPLKKIVKSTRLAKMDYKTQHCLEMKFDEILGEIFECKNQIDDISGLFCYINPSSKGSSSVKLRNVSLSFPEEWKMLFLIGQRTKHGNKLTFDNDKLFDDFYKNCQQSWNFLYLLVGLVVTSMTLAIATAFYEKCF